MPKEISEKKIYRFAKRYKIPKNEIYQLDTSYYSWLLSLDTFYCDTMPRNLWPKEKIKLKNQIKNHYQPLQAIYFDSTNHMVSFQINCYAGGFPNLKWDRDSILTLFPPKVQAPLDSLVLDTTLRKYLQPMAHSKQLTFKGYDYVVYVFWNKFMGRQNRRFINFIHSNYNLSSDNNVKFVYVSMDNFFTLTDIW